MSNHYHLVIETPDGNLSKGMRQLNGVHTQATNPFKVVSLCFIELVNFVQISLSGIDEISRYLLET